MTDLSSPTLTPIQTEYKDIRVPNQNWTQVGEGVGVVAAAIGDSEANKSIEAYQKTVDEFTGEEVQVEDMFNSMLNHSKELNQQMFDTYSPEVAKMGRELQRLQLLGDQKSMSSNTLMAMKEDVFRRYATAHSALIPQFLKAAKMSGLSSTGVSYREQASLDMYNSDLKDAQTLHDDRTKQMHDAHYYEENYGNSFERTWNAYLQFANIQTVLSAAKSRVELEGYDKQSKMEYTTQVVDSVWPAWQADGYNRLSVMSDGLSKAYTNSDEALAGLDKNFIPNLKKQYFKDSTEYLDSLKVALRDAFVRDTGIDPTSPKIGEYINERLKGMYAVQAQVMAATSISDFSTIRNITQGAAQEVAKHDLHITPMTTEIAKIMVAAKMGGVEMQAATRGVAAAVLSKPLEQARLLAQADEITKNPATSPDGGYNNLIDKRVSDPEAQGKKDQDYLGTLKVFTTTFDAMQPSTQRNSLNWLVSKVAGFDAAYKANDSSRPSHTVIDQTMGALNSEALWTYVNSPGADKNAANNLKVTAVTTAGYELATTGREILMAYTKARAVITKESRPLTQEEQVSLSGILGASGMAGGNPSLPKATPVTAEERVWLEATSEGHVEFVTKSPELGQFVSELNNQKQGDSTVSERISRMVNVISMATSSTTEQALNKVTGAIEYNFPSTFIKKEEDPTNGGK